MREILSVIGTWHRERVPFALATVVNTWGSSPRQPGASLAVTAAGEVVGSVSGGCVEGAVYELAGEVLRTGAPALATDLTYGLGVSGPMARNAADLATALDILTDALALVGQHGVYCRSSRQPQYPAMDVRLVLQQIEDSKALIITAMQELKRNQ